MSFFKGILEPQKFLDSSMITKARFLGVPKPGCFKPGCLQSLRGSALLRSFAPFCALLRSFADLRLRSFALTFALFCADFRALFWELQRLHVHGSTFTDFCLCLYRANRRGGFGPPLVTPAEPLNSRPWVVSQHLTKC